MVVEANYVEESTTVVAMDSAFLTPLATSGPKARQVKDAQLMQQAVLERAQRTGETPPPYEFLELIGKGTYGRVYKR